MSVLKDRCLSFVRQYGKAAKVVATGVLSAAGAGPLVALVEAAFDRAADIAHDNWEDELLRIAQANAGELERLDRLIAALTTDLAPLCDAAADAVARGVHVETAVQELLARDSDLQESFEQLGERLATKLDATYAEVRALHAKVDHLLDERLVATSAAQPLAVSVTNERERDFLRKVRAKYRLQPVGVVSAEQWSALGDGLAGAGEFAAAQECQTAAAAAPCTSVEERAEAHFKAYRSACELRRWDDALAELRAAVSLQPALYRPFETKRYETVAILGAGGFGTVFHCRDRDNQGAAVAIKTLHAADLAREVNDIFAEVHTLNALNHPAIVRSLSHGFADPDKQERPYFVLEFFDGPTLEAHLKHHGNLSLDDVLALAWTVAEAVLAAHAQGIYHRDLKPGNLLIRRDAHGWVVKVIDFGLAVRLRTAVQLSQAGGDGHSTQRAASFTGTLDYAAPEQKGKLPGVKIGPYSDVYAFGKTCQMALFGTTEPKSKDWRKLPDDRREAVQDLFEGCTCEPLADRWPSFAEVLERLQKLRTDATKEARRRNAEAERQRLAEAAGRAAHMEALRQEQVREQVGAEAQRRVLAERRERERLEGEKKLISMKFVRVPKGTGWLGGGGGKLGTNEFTLSEELYCGIYPVTQSEWEAVMGTNPSKFKDAPDAKNCPVEQVSYNDVEKFLVTLNGLEKSRGGGRAYRLPTEQEWEYICRGGPVFGAESGYHFYCGEPSNDLSGDDAQFDADYQVGTAAKLPKTYYARTCKVGSYKPNKTGIYDMHGNVWEWTSSLYSHSSRVVRGGSWSSYGGDCAASNRGSFNTSSVYVSVGFRLLAVPSSGE